MKVEVSFQIDQEALAAAVLRMVELVEGSADENELESLLDALRDADRFEVDPADEI